MPNNVGTNEPPIENRSIFPQFWLKVSLFMQTQDFQKCHQK
jgi:hypothetical protein